MDEILVSCKKCGKKSFASLMRLDLDEKLVICPECFTAKRIKRKKDETPAASETQNKVSVKCISCGYVFRANPETKQPRSCPYCDERILSYS